MTVYSMEFLVIWGAILVLDAVMMVGLTWAATSTRYSKWRLRTPGPGAPAIPKGKKLVNTTLNNIMALLVFIAFLYLAGGRFLSAPTPGIAHLLGEVLAVLLLYDFMYYFFHRGMHLRGVMRYCHAVHHRVRFPLADESIYTHPLETLGGLSLLLLSIMALGPISPASFLVIFFLYSTINIIVHANLIIPHPAFRLFNFWVEKHDVHHKTARSNYASIFPFWDQAFGTLK